MEIKEIFEHLISQPSWWTIAGIEINDATSYKYNYKHGKLREAFMVWLVWKAGWIDRLKQNTPT